MDKSKSEEKRLDIISSISSYQGLRFTENLSRHFDIKKKN